MTAPQNPHRARLAARLRALRAAAGLSGSELARQLGWPQPRVSKLETAKQLPSDADIRLWLDATNASDDHDELAELVSAARVEYATWRGVQRTVGGLAGRHAERAVREAATTRIAEYQPAMIPGLVQTAAYARELLTSPLAVAMDITNAQVDGLVAERVKRQELLYQPGRTLQVIVGETALWSTPGTTEVLINQLDRLISFAGLPNLEFGVMPRTAAMPIAPVSCFTVFDDDVVLVETLTGEQELFDPDEVAVYVKAFDQLRNVAQTGRGAVELIQHVAEELRRS